MAKNLLDPTYTGANLQVGSAAGAHRFGASADKADGGHSDGGSSPHTTPSTPKSTSAKAGAHNSSVADEALGDSGRQPPSSKMSGRTKIVGNAQGRKRPAAQGSGRANPYMRSPARSRGPEPLASLVLTPAAQSVGEAHGSANLHVADLERATQERAIHKLRALGYDYLGNKMRSLNSNIDAELLRNNLAGRGYSPQEIAGTLAILQREANRSTHTLYQRNKAVYELLRFGVKVQSHASANTVTVFPIDWRELGNNHFAFAEEVSIASLLPGGRDCRPDIVVYVNGIALAVLELKRATVSVADGIRQNLRNQEPGRIEHFFSTVQLVMAGSATEGIRYGVIGTKTKHCMQWQEPALDAFEEANPLERHLRQLLSRERLLELVHDFIMFDAGLKKICRQNQYFAIKAVQALIRADVVGLDSHGGKTWAPGPRKGGIIWHTQGSGKSLLMAQLWRWIREFDPQARLAVFTDRKELDEQSVAVFNAVSMRVHRATSVADLAAALASTDDSRNAICSLIHKFGSADDEAPDEARAYAQELAQAARGAIDSDHLYVFVDECHRTQSGALHQAMRAMIPNARFIGFTGTPLLKSDKPSVSVFGDYLHKYLFPEGIRDGVTTDLRYEARDIEQTLSSQAKVDAWFDKQTQGLSALARSKLMKAWANKQKILSSASRIEKITQSIVFDFAMKEPLAEGRRGNAILVASSIFDACRYYKEFVEDGDLRGRVAVVSSFVPAPNKIDDSDAESVFKQAVYVDMIAQRMGCSKDDAPSKAEAFESEVKRMFRDEPEQMKLLIVVDKLLTGFDAPSATYLYIDKPMEDHALFQAMCRTNRPDPLDESKQYGYIVDFRNLFGKVQNALMDYTASSNPLAGYEASDVDGLLKDAALDAADRLEAIRAEASLITAGVRGESVRDFLSYFQTPRGANEPAQREMERKRTAFHQTVSAYARAYDALGDANLFVHFDEDVAKEIQREVRTLLSASEVVMRECGDFPDLKSFDPQMKKLVDKYIDASDPQTVAGFENLSLLEMVIAQVEQQPQVALPIAQASEQNIQSIEHNLRSKIWRSATASGAEMEKMSEMLQQLLDEVNSAAIDYKAFLEKIAQLAKTVDNPALARGYPASINTRGRQDFYSLFPQLDSPARASLALAIDEAIKSSRQDGWRDHVARHRRIQIAIKARLDQDALENAQLSRLLEEAGGKLLQDVMNLATANLTDYA